MKEEKRKKMDRGRRLIRRGKRDERRRRKEMDEGKLKRWMQVEIKEEKEEIGRGWMDGWRAEGRESD